MNFIQHRSSRHSRSGFTLVELLVVIGIIAILASVVAVSAGSAINSAKRAKAGNAASQLQTAILNYYTEYSVYPVASGAAAGDTLYPATTAGGAAEAPLMISLCGNINASTAVATTSTVPNTRQIAFLTPKRSDVDPNGVLINPFSTGSTYYYFGISMDTDYSGILGDTGGAAPPSFTNWTTGNAQPGTANLTQGVAIWACCDPNYLANPAGSKSPNFWVHTY